MLRLTQDSVRRTGAVRLLRIVSIPKLMNTETQQTVLVTGAAVFVGKEAVARRLERGWGVSAMVRWPESAPFAPYPPWEIVVANMRDRGSWRTAVAGAAAVVHLAATIADERESDDINIHSAQRLVAA